MKAEQAVDALFHSMKEALMRGERIELRGFGVFVVKPRKRGVGRNPRTGEEVAIPSGKTIRFKPGKELQAHDGGTEPAAGGGAADTRLPDSTY
jgi:DNA-binding protein HU-beta